MRDKISELRYKAEFFDNFISALKESKDKFTTNEQGNLTNSRENTGLWIQALRTAADKAGDIAMLMLLNATCEV